MKMTTSVPMGANKVVIEGDSLKQLFMACGFFAKIPQTCGHCKSKNLSLFGHKNSGYDFFSVICLDCRYELKFGQKKEDNSLFLRDDQAWEPPYEGGSRQQQQQQEPQQQQPPQGGGAGGDEDEIPF